MNNKILFSIPGFSADKFLLNSILIKIFSANKDKFYDDISIDSVFDSFKCVLAGGRTPEVMPNESNLEDILGFFNSNGISVRNVFTNKLTTSEYVDDYTSNFILDKNEEIGKRFNITNGCTLNSINLFNHIKTYHPNIQTIWSTTLEVYNIDKINELSKDNLLVVSYNFNNKWELIDKLKYPNNIEFLAVEEGCIPNCQQRNLHNLILSYSSLGLDISKDKELSNFVCSQYSLGENCGFYTHTINRPYYISYELIKNEYLPRGFNKFKISGRSPGQVTIINSLEAYLNLFVKPEYINQLRTDILVNYLTIRIDKNICRR